MTKLGKLFVFAQFILSIGALTTAIVSFSFHMRGRAKNENYFQPEIKKQTEQISRLAEARDRAEARWQDANNQIRVVEAFRPQAQAFYNAKLILALKGKAADGSDVPNPVQALVYQQSDPANLETRTFVYNLIGPTAIEHRGTKVPAYETIQQSLRSRQKVIQDQQKEIATALQTYTRLTHQLQGEPGVKGLYLERELMEASRKRAIAQQDLLKPSLANRYSEAVLVLKRQNSLLQRKQELEKVGVAAGNSP